MNIRNWFNAGGRGSNSGTDKSAGPRFTFIFVILSVLFLSATGAQAQTAVSYRFLEVVDSAGQPIANATVQTNTSTHQTDENGAVKRLPVWAGDYNTTTLKVSKPGYFTCEDIEVKFYHYQYLFEGENIHRDSWGPIKVELLRIPLNPTDHDADEAEQRKRELLLASRRGDAATVQKLLQAGVDARTTDADGVPAVLWAVTSGVGGAINALLAAGAEPGPKALRYYLHYSNAAAINDKTVRELLKAVTDINATDNNGQTALILAAASAAPHSQEAIKILLESGAATNAKDGAGRTALLAAMGVDNVEKVKLLLAAGADVNATNQQGQTVLILAAASAMPHANEALKMLLESGAAIDAKDNDGRTALMIAILNDFTSNKAWALEKVKLLLSAGADPNIQDIQGQTALLFARKSGAETVINLLEAVTRP